MSVERSARGAPRAGAGRDRFPLALGLLLLAALVWRALYVWAQSALDPWYAHPLLDGAYYWRWAEALAHGEPGPRGAFYLAPLYPYLLALFLRVYGANLFLLYLLQQTPSVGTAGLIAACGRPVLGTAAAMAAAALFLLYHPLVFFASRPLGETLAIALLVGGLVAMWRSERARWRLLAGALLGTAALARPNLLLVLLLWAAVEVVRRRGRAAAALVGAAALVLLPVGIRNLAVSGHFVPVSSNAGLTAYHGNGPGAQGVYTQPEGFAWGVDRQREQAVRLARARTGRALDAVEADAWWGRQALRERVEHPGQTLRLLGRRLLLTLANPEPGLDYPPMLDTNPWRLAVRGGIQGQIALVPWALLLGLASTGMVFRGPRGCGGWETWTALAATAAVPLLFYLSSRYRLPTAALLTVPAGAGAAVVREALHGRRARRAVGALLTAAAVTVASFALGAPFRGLIRSGTADGLSNRALAYEASGRPEAAVRDARRAVRLRPDSVRLEYNLGVVLDAAGEPREAERAYRRALELRPDFSEAAANLGSLLFREGRYGEAIPVLRLCLALRPDAAKAWTSLVVNLVGAGKLDEARAAAADARRHGVELPPGLLETIDGLERKGSGPRRGGGGEG